MQSSDPAHTDGMPVRLHHIVVDAYDLPRLAQFWTQVLGWKVLFEREREIVIGTDENAPVGMCFMPVTDPKIVKNRVHLDLTSSAHDRDQEIERLLALGACRVDNREGSVMAGEDRTAVVLLDVEEVARRLRTKLRFVRRLIAERRIEFHKLGRYVRISEAALDDYIKAGRVEPIRNRRRGRAA